MDKIGYSFKRILLILLLCFLAVFGLAGIAVYAIYSRYRGLIWLRNQFIGFWLSTLLFFFSIQSLYVLLKDPKHIINSFLFITDLIYFILIAIGCLFLTICYGFAMRVDSFVFGIVIMLVNILSVCILCVRRYKEVKKEKLKKRYEATTDEIEPLDQKPQKCKCFRIFLKILNAILKFLFLILLAFLIAGSFVIGAGSLKYPPRGKFVQVPLSDKSGRYINIHYLCDGPISNSTSTFMFESDGSHSYADFLGLQSLLTLSNRRSCIWDKAGLGYSDFMYADMYDNSLYYHNFIKLIGEKEPFHFVGWGGGGSIIYNYASEHPEMFKSITLLDTYPLKYEWTTPAVLKNWSDSELNSYINSDLAKRFQTIYSINALAIPFGIMAFFYPSSSFYPPYLTEEKNWFFLTEKTWITQKYYLEQLAYEDDVFSSKKINKSIPINHIMSIKNDNQVINSTCIPKNFDAQSVECQYEIKANRYSIVVRKNLTSLTNKGKIYECFETSCGQSFLVYDNPQFTAKALLELNPN